MPKANPKHNRTPVRTTTAVKHYNKSHVNIKYVVLGIVALAILVPGSIGLYQYIESVEQSKLFVEIGDTIEIRYTLWLSNDNQEKVDKLQEGTFDSTMKETASETGLIYGFWKNIQNMGVGVPKEFWLPKCIDDGEARPTGVILHPDCVAQDGWDDRYPIGSVYAQSYGYDNLAWNIDHSQQYNLRYTAIIFRVEILHIDKGTA